MSDLALLVKLQAQVAVFLADLPADQLLALAEGRASLTVVNGATEARPPALSPATREAPIPSPATGETPIPSPATGETPVASSASRGAAMAAPVASGAAVAAPVASGAASASAVTPGAPATTPPPTPEIPAASRNGRSAAAPRPRKAAPNAEPIEPATIIERLRASETVIEATELLARLKLRVADLRLLAKQLQIPGTGNKAELEKRVLHLTVGARSKHAGLRQG